MPSLIIHALDAALAPMRTGRSNDPAPVVPRWPHFARGRKAAAEQSRLTPGRRRCEVLPNVANALAFRKTYSRLPMDFSFTPEQTQIRDEVARLCVPFDDDYWLKKDTDGGFPHDFHAAVAKSGWLGIAMPTEHGGSGLGVMEASIMMQTIAESGACMSGASAVHMNIFGLLPVVVFGTKEQQARMLPPLIAGKDKSCFAVTEPNSGLNTTQLKTKAVKMSNGNYAVSGQKIWISTAQVANKVLLLCRTTPFEDVKKKTDGLSLFYTDFDRKKIEVREIPKMGRRAVDSNMVYFDNVEVPAADLIGKEGDGFKQILHGMNPERILVAAEAIGIGRIALKKASKYARERVVFGRPIGQNQGIQHPLAQAWMNLEAANLMIFKAATLYDKGEECGVEANAAKYLAAEAGFTACQTAIMSMGGMGYAKEYHIERYLRESFLPRIAPISPHLIMNYIAERVLELPRSY
jgi:acyl-CoA dehydrogenase